MIFFFHVVWTRLECILNFTNGNKAIKHSVTRAFYYYRRPRHAGRRPTRCFLHIQCKKIIIIIIILARQFYSINRADIEKGPLRVRRVK